jgi:hypothetical protein
VTGSTLLNRGTAIGKLAELLCESYGLRLSLGSATQLAIWLIDEDDSVALSPLKKLRHQDQRRLVHQQVDMFRHQDVSIDPGLMTCARLFQNGLECLLGPTIQETEVGECN